MSYRRGFRGRVEQHLGQPRMPSWRDRLLRLEGRSRQGSGGAEQGAWIDRGLARLRGELRLAGRILCYCVAATAWGGKVSQWRPAIGSQAATAWGDTVAHRGPAGQP